jgi:hypothetical protein
MEVIMAYQDPDPLRDPMLDRDLNANRRSDYGSNAMWGWIAGAVVLVLMLVFLFGGTTENTTTSGLSNSPGAPTINTPPAANNAANPPRPMAPLPSETTGQSSSPSPSPQQ